MESTFSSRLYHNEKKDKQANIKIQDKSKEFEDDYIVIAITSTGIQVTNRDQWLRDKWAIRKKRYLEIYTTVNIKSKKIFSMVVNDVNIHDSSVLPELVDEIIKSNNTTVVTDYCL